jgi:hypothetical protein
MFHALKPAGSLTGFEVSMLSREGRHFQSQTLGD